MGNSIPERRSLLDRIFFSSDERRPRALWRILGQLVLLFLFGLLVAIALGWLLFFELPFEAGLLVQQVIAVLAVTASVFAARRWLDRRSIRSLGLVWNAQAGRDLLAGIFLPALMMGLVFAVEWAAGWLVIEGYAWQAQPTGEVLAATGLLLLAFVLVGWNEELLSRGYHLQNLAEGLNPFWGVVLSSAAFAALHYANPSFTNTSMPFLGLFLAGLFLAYGWVRTRQLWLPIGLHIGWNFFEGPVFGFPVSGLRVFSLVRQTATGPELFTGGRFGPEGGLILLPALALGAVLVYLYTQGRTAADSS